MADATKAKVNELKAQGNAALEIGELDEAIGKYTEAIQLDPSNHVLYSNRSAALTKAGRYLEALGDADKTIEIKPEWFKGYSRKGAAMCLLNRYQEAAETYEQGLQQDPDNQQLQDGLRDAKSHLTGPADSQPIGNPFAMPDVMEKLTANPTTREFLKQADYRMLLDLLKQNPNNLQNIKDPRIITTLGVLLGFDLSGAKSNDQSEMSDSAAPSSSPPAADNSSSNTTTTASNDSNTQTPQQNHADATQKQALQEKEQGNAAYKQKKFDEAHQHYDKAIELDPVNITYRTNKAAVYFEQGLYDKCIEECEQAVNIGRENRVEYTLIAKAFARIGKAYMKQDDEENALRYYNKSLAEHRTTEVAKQINEIKKKLIEKERLAYINPEKAMEAKAKGNECFQNGNYPEAKKHYDEAIKRNPDDSRLYSNRAACYTKLLEFALALKDAEKCIELDPAFIKGYLRKGAVLTGMKDSSKAIAAYQKALDLDPKCEEAMKGYREAVMAESSNPEAVRRRAMADPEVQQILSDPAMKLILQQMQEDPNAVREHLKNPEVAAKIEKLMQCGILAIR